MHQETLHSVWRYWEVSSSIKQHQAVSSSIKQYQAVLSSIKQYWGVSSSIEQCPAVSKGVWIISERLSQTQGFPDVCGREKKAVISKLPVGWNVWFYTSSLHRPNHKKYPHIEKLGVEMLQSLKKSCYKFNRKSNFCKVREGIDYLKNWTGWRLQMGGEFVLGVPEDSSRR